MVHGALCFSQNNGINISWSIMLSQQSLMILLLLDAGLFITITGLFYAFHYLLSEEGRILNIYIRYKIHTRVKKLLDNICLTDNTEHNVQQNIVILGATRGFRIPAVLIIIYFVDTEDNGSQNISLLTFLPSQRNCVFICMIGL